MSKVSLQIGFFLYGQHYAQMQAFLPRIQALKIPQLNITEKILRQKQSLVSKQQQKKSTKSKIQKSEISQSKKAESDDQMNNQQIDQNNIDLNQLQNEPDNDQDQPNNINEYQEMICEQRIDSQKQQQNLMQYLQDDQDSEDDLDDDLSSNSKMSGMRNNHKTKRQKGERLGLMELPDRRPRKDKKMDQATQIIRREEKERKRKQYLKKQIQAQQKATLDKILNQTGRKLKLKQQKQVQDIRKRDQKAFKGLGEIPKIITITNQQSNLIMLHNMNLFNQEMTRIPEIKVKPNCSHCVKQEGRYKIKNTNKTACSLVCYKIIQSLIY